MRNSYLSLSILVFLAIAGPLAQVRAQKYDPEHPVVKELVSKGMAYLTSSGSKPAGGAQSVVGTDMLTAYTIYKVDGDPGHPIVESGVRQAKGYVDGITGSGARYTPKAVYELSVACMLLASVDVDAYSPQLIKARDFFIRIQQSTGGFGYIDGSHKDTSSDISQTQYVLLAFWTMSQLGIEIPEDRIVRVIAYLLEAQIKNPSTNMHGGWPYQFEPGASNQNSVSTCSLTAAGLSSILIAGDTLGLYRNRLAEAEEEDGLIPVAFKRIVPESEKPQKGASFDRARIDASVNLGLLFNRNNPYQRLTWHYYYLYSLERFESFLEIANRKQIKSPDWYNAEVERLRAAQGKDGSWGGGDADLDPALGPQASTCFAILFLIRSTQKAIGDLKEGVVRGWAALPEDISAVTMVNGKPVNKTEATSIDDALKMLEDDKSAQGEDRLVDEKILFSKDPARRKDELNRFARLLRSRDYQARRVAAKVLGRSDDLDMVPELVFALSDPDAVVCRNAETSLRLISRRLDKYHIPKEGAISDQQRIVARREWQTWFLALRPDYIFVD
jgi:hypothetical protein